MPEAIDLLYFAILGLIAGGLGGLLGLGGSLVMIPALTLLLGRDQHVSQAAAMIVNVCIAVPSFRHHRSKGSVRVDVFWKMMPIGIGFMVIGVATSNLLDGQALKRLFGVFLMYVVVFSLGRAYVSVRDRVRRVTAEDGPELITWPRAGLVGGLMGLLGGLLGIGGGGITVPLLQRVCNLPLRHAIGTSSAVMVITATIGAVQKNLSLVVSPQIADAESGSILLAILAISACLIPTGIVGSMYGARLTHILPTWLVHLVFALLMSWAAMQMLGVL